MASRVWSAYTLRHGEVGRASLGVKENSINCSSLDAAVAASRGAGAFRRTAAALVGNSWGIYQVQFGESCVAAVAGPHAVRDVYKVHSRGIYHLNDISRGGVASGYILEQSGASSSFFSDALSNSGGDSPAAVTSGLLVFAGSISKASE